MTFQFMSRLNTPVSRVIRLFLFLIFLEHLQIGRLHCENLHTSVLYSQEVWLPLKGKKKAILCETNPYLTFSLWPTLYKDLALLDSPEIACGKWGIENSVSKSVGSQTLRNQFYTQSITTHLYTVNLFPFLWLTESLVGIANACLRPLWNA